jgi:large subunit ribosomal protein L10
MNRSEKTAVIDEIAGQLGEAEAVFAVDYRGISVTQVAELRSKLRDADATFRVVKNSLTELAADKAGVETLKQLLDGPTALTFVRGDAALAAKALSDTARATQVLDFKGGLMNGAELSADDIRSIARLPAREVLYGQLVGIVASPITGVVRGLNALLSGLAIQLKAIHDQGLVSGEAPSAPAEQAPPAEEAEAPAAEEAPAEEAEAPAEEAEALAAEEAPAEEADAPAEEEPAAEAAAEPDAQTDAADEAAPETDQADDGAEAAPDADDAPDAKEEA